MKIFLVAMLALPFINYPSEFQNKQDLANCHLNKTIICNVVPDDNTIKVKQ